MNDVMQHIGLVRYVARAYQWALGPSLEQADLEQEGLLGVAHALRKFDPQRGRFSTYAVPWIRHYIQRTVYAQCRTVRAPMAKAKAAYKGGAPLSLSTTSLDAKPRINGHDADGNVEPMANLLGFVVDPQGPKNIDDAERSELVAHLLSTLSEREATVLRLRFFEDLTLHEAGRRIGLTKERTRQIQDSALRRIEGRMLREQP